MVRSKPIELGVSLAQLISDDGTELTKLKFIPSLRPGNFSKSPDFFFTVQNIHEYVRLHYETENPIDRVISQLCLDKYNTIFFFLLKIKRVNHCLTQIWKELNSAEFRVSKLQSFSALLLYVLITILLCVASVKE